MQVKPTSHGHSAKEDIEEGKFENASFTRSAGKHELDKGKCDGARSSQCLFAIGLLLGLLLGLSVSAAKSSVTQLLTLPVFQSVVGQASHAFACEVGKNYVGEGICLEDSEVDCPLTGIVPLQGCADVCAAHASCTTFVYNEARECYLKSDWSYAERATSTTSCRKVSGAMGVSSRKDPISYVIQAKSAQPICQDFWNCISRYWIRPATSIPMSMAALDGRPHANTTLIPWHGIHSWCYKGDIKVSPEFAKYIQLHADRAVLPLFHAEAQRILGQHYAQTAQEAKKQRLQARSWTLFGQIEPMELVMRLAFTSDRTDSAVGAVTQFVHTMQVWHTMKLDGVTDRELLFAGIIHDVGKLGSYVDDDAFSDGCSKGLDYEDVATGAGMDKLTIPFDHHDFGLDKLRSYISPRLRMIMRYHCFEDLMNDDPRVHRIMSTEDQSYLPLLKQFFLYDQLSKSQWILPNIDMGEVRSLLREFLPEVIFF